MKRIEKRAFACARLTLSGVLVAAATLLGTVTSAHAGQQNMHGSMNMGNGHMNMTHQAATPSSTAPSSLSVTDCWIRALPSPAPSAGYFVIHNNGTQQAMLGSASSPAFGMVMLHQSIETGGMSKMKMVHNVPVPAGGVLAFKPGSYHAMLEQPINKLVVGSHVDLDLSFGSGTVVKTSCVVKPAGTLAN